MIMKANLFLRLHADGSENPNQSGFAVLTPAEGSPYERDLCGKPSNPLKR